MKKIKTLDGLRGYAALFVLIGHFPFKEYWFPDFLEKISIAYFGIEIFFVLSGFLITRILINEKKQNCFSFKRFYLKRAIRIFPIYYLAIIIFGFLISWEKMGYVASYTSNYLFAFDQTPHPFRHSWSLAIEEQYYLIWPFLLYFLTLRKSKFFVKFIIPLLAISCSFLIVEIFNYQDANALIYRGIQSKILSLSIGSYFAFIEPNIYSIKRNRLTVFFLIIMITASILVLINVDEILLTFNSIPVSILLLLLYSIAASCLFLVVLILEKTGSVFRYIFTNKIIVFCGLISYGLYLYHLPILYYFEISHMHYDKIFNSKTLIISISLIIIVPIVSYFLIEKPILKLKQYLK